MYTSTAIVSTHLDGFKYCYLTPIILFNINHWFADNKVVTSIAIQHYSFICILLNGSIYSYVIQMIQFRQRVKEFQILLFNTNISIQYYSFVCTQLNGSKYCNVSLTIQLNSNLFTYS